MPSKKKKYNARFPAGRIKKIMQTDEEVGKVAQAVPVIISRTLELFVESLLTKSMHITVSRNAKTLTPSHMKQCILSESRFDFLKDLVKNVPDASVQEDNENNEAIAAESAAAASQATTSNVDTDDVKEIDYSLNARSTNANINVFLEQYQIKQENSSYDDKRYNHLSHHQVPAAHFYSEQGQSTSNVRAPVIQYSPKISKHTVLSSHRSTVIDSERKEEISNKNSHGVFHIKEDNPKKNNSESVVSNNERRCTEISNYNTGFHSIPPDHIITSQHHYASQFQSQPSYQSLTSNINALQQLASPAHYAYHGRISSDDSLQIDEDYDN